MPSTQKANQIEQHWTDYAAARLLGRKITHVRYMFDEEMRNLGWVGRSLVLVLDDGSLIYPSTDDEGNGPGALFGVNPGGDDMTFPVI